MGALDLVQVVKLENGIINSDVDISQFKFYDVSQLLLSNLFELDNVRSDDYLKIYNERKTLIFKDSETDLSEDERKRLKELDEQISLFDPCDGEEMRRTRQLLEQIAKNMHHD